MRVTARQYRDMAGLSGDARRTFPASAFLSGQTKGDVKLLVPSDLTSSLDLAGAAAPVLSGVSLTVSLPPSLNNIYVNSQCGRVKSKPYRRWLCAAQGEASVQRPRPIVGRYDLAILVPRSMRGDIDNRIKPVSDLLVKMGIVSDDSQADCVMVRRSDGVPHGRCIVSVNPVSPPPVGVGCGPRPLPSPLNSRAAGAEAAMV